MKSIYTLTMAGCVIAFSASAPCATALPSTRSYVTAKLTEEAQYRRASDDAILDQLVELRTTLTLVGAAVDNLATNLQTASASLTGEQLGYLADAVGAVSTNLSIQARHLHDSLKSVVTEAASVHMVTSWIDRGVVDLGTLTPVASNEYRLVSWPLLQSDGRVRQYMAYFTAPSAGFLHLPQGAKADYGNRLDAGTNLLMCTDISGWLFVQLRPVED